MANQLIYLSLSGVKAYGAESLSTSESDIITLEYSELTSEEKISTEAAFYIIKLVADNENSKVIYTISDDSTENSLEASNVIEKNNITYLCFQVSTSKAIVISANQVEGDPEYIQIIDSVINDLNAIQDGLNNLNAKYSNEEEFINIPNSSESVVSTENIINSLKNTTIDTENISTITITEKPKVSFNSENITTSKTSTKFSIGLNKTSGTIKNDITLNKGIIANAISASEDVIINTNDIETDSSIYLPEGGINSNVTISNSVYSPDIKVDASGLNITIDDATTDEITETVDNYGYHTYLRLYTSAQDIPVAISETSNITEGYVNSDSKAILSINNGSGSLRLNKSEDGIYLPFTVNKGAYTHTLAATSADNSEVSTDDLSKALQVIEFNPTVKVTESQYDNDISEYASLQTSSTGLTDKYISLTIPGIVYKDITLDSKFKTTEDGYFSTEVLSDSSSIKRHIFVNSNKSSYYLPLTEDLLIAASDTPSLTNSFTPTASTVNVTSLGVTDLEDGSFNIPLKETITKGSVSSSSVLTKGYVSEDKIENVTTETDTIVTLPTINLDKANLNVLWSKDDSTFDSASTSKLVEDTINKTASLQGYYSANVISEGYIRAGRLTSNSFKFDIPTSTISSNFTLTNTNGILLNTSKPSGDYFEFEITPSHSITESGYAFFETVQGSTSTYYIPKAKFKVDDDGDTLYCESAGYIESGTITDITVGSFDKAVIDITSNTTIAGNTTNDIFTTTTPTDLTAYYKIKTTPTISNAGFISATNNVLTLPDYYIKKSILSNNDLTLSYETDNELNITDEGVLTVTPSSSVAEGYVSAATVSKSFDIDLGASTTGLSLTPTSAKVTSSIKGINTVTSSDYSISFTGTSGTVSGTATTSAGYTKTATSKSSTVAVGVTAPNTIYIESGAASLTGGELSSLESSFKPTISLEDSTTLTSGSYNLSTSTPMSGVYYVKLGASGFENTITRAAVSPKLGTAGYISNASQISGLEEASIKFTVSAADAQYLTLSSADIELAGGGLSGGGVSFTPAISKYESDGSNAGINIQASTGTVTTTEPSSGYYVAVQSGSQTAKTITRAAVTRALSAAGYIGATSQISGLSSTASTTVGLNASSITYVPINSASATVSGGGLSGGNTSITPTISKYTTDGTNAGINIQASTGTVTTTEPSSGYYVAVQSNSSSTTGTVTRAAVSTSVDSKGYLNGTNQITNNLSSAATHSVTSTLNKSAVTYIPVTAGKISAGINNNPTITVSESNSKFTASITVQPKAVVEAAGYVPTGTTAGSEQTYNLDIATYDSSTKTLTFNF